MFLKVWVQYFFYKIKKLIIFLKRSALIIKNFFIYCSFALILIILFLILNLNFFINPIVNFILTNEPIYVKLDNFKIIHFNKFFIEDAEVYLKQKSGYTEKDFKICKLKNTNINLSILNLFKLKIDSFISVKQIESVIFQDFTFDMKIFSSYKLTNKYKKQNKKQDYITLSGHSNIFYKNQINSNAFLYFNNNINNKIVSNFKWKDFSNKKITINFNALQDNKSKLNKSNSTNQENKDKMLWQANLNAKNLNLEIYKILNLAELKINQSIINYLKSTMLSGKLSSINANFSNKDNKMNIYGSGFIRDVNFTFDENMPNIQKANGLIYFNENFTDYFIKSKLSSNLAIVGFVKHNYNPHTINILCSTSGEVINAVSFIDAKTLSKLKNKNIDLLKIIGSLNCLVDMNISINETEKNDIKINAISRIFNFNWKNFLNVANLKSDKIDLQIKNNILTINNKLLIDYKEEPNLTELIYEQDLINNTIAIDGVIFLNNYFLNKFDFLKIGGKTNLEFKYRNFNNENYLAIFSNLTNVEFEMQNMFAKKIKVYSRLNAIIDMKKNIIIKANLIANKENNFKNTKEENDYFENLVMYKINTSLKPLDKINASLEVEYKDINSYNINGLFEFDKSINLIKVNQQNNHFKLNLLSDFLDISRINFNSFIKSNKKTNTTSEFNLKIKNLNLFNNVKFTNLDANINIDQIGHINGDISAQASNIMTTIENIKNKTNNKLSKEEINNIKKTLMQNKQTNTAKMIEEFVQLNNYTLKSQEAKKNSSALQINTPEILFLQEKEKLLNKNNKQLSKKEKSLLKNLLNPVKYPLNIKLIGSNMQNYIILDTANAGLLLRGLFAYQKLEKGNLNLLCLNVLDKDITQYHSNNLKCNFNLNNFIMTDNSFLTSLITYVSLTGIIKFITMNKDYEFDSLIGEFSMNNSIINIKAIDSEGLHFDYNAKGLINLDKKTVTLNGRLIPSFFYLTKITKYIPIIKEFLYKKIFAPFKFNFKY